MASPLQRLSWERSTEEILLEKLKFALRNHQGQEALESFHDFRKLYGYPEIHLVNQLIIQLSYSNNHVWVRKACGLALKIVEEKSGLLHVDTLTKLALSMARMQMPSPASVIPKLMLNKGGTRREAKALLKQMKKINLDKELSDDAVDKHILCEETSKFSW